MASGLLERAAELAALQSAIDELHRGVGAVVLLSGEAGIGKTSLVKAFRRTLDKRVRVRSGACEDLLSLRTLGPLRDAVRGESTPLADALAAGDQDAVFAALLADLSDPRRPTVLVVEDIHWADDATLDVLRFLGRRIATLPAVLLVTYRDDAFSLRPSLRRLLGGLSGAGVRRVELHGLSPDAVARMAGRHASAGALVRRRLRALGVERLPRGPQPATRANPAGLTSRQVQILRLIADGLTNAEIAARLVVSVRTVDHHVSAVLQKLGVPSRQAARAAATDLDRGGLKRRGV